MSNEQLDRATELVLTLIRGELKRARERFPGNRHMLAAKTEEDGEVANAFIEHERGNPDVAAADVVNECVQSAVMAIRLATEGDAGFMFNSSFLGEGVSSDGL